jgi:hypothetical protein
MDELEAGLKLDDVVMLAAPGAVQKLDRMHVIEIEDAPATADRQPGSAFTRVLKPQKLDPIIFEANRMWAHLAA